MNKWLALYVAALAAGAAFTAREAGQGNTATDIRASLTVPGAGAAPSEPAGQGPANRGRHLRAPLPHGGQRQEELPRTAAANEGGHQTRRLVRVLYPARLPDPH